MGKIKEFFSKKVEEWADFVDEHPILYYGGCFVIGSIIGQDIANKQIAKRLKKLEKDTYYLHENDACHLALLNDVAKLNGKKLIEVKTGTDDLGLGIFCYEWADIQTESEENAD